MKALQLKVKEAEAKLIEAEANTIRAAEAGQELVQKLANAEYERDKMLQERYELKNSLENKSAMFNLVLEELEVIKDQVADADEQHIDELAKLTADIESKEKSWRRKEIDLESTIDQLKTELESVTKKVKALEEAATAAAVAVASAARDVSIVSDDGTALLQEELIQVRQQNSELKTHNLELAQFNDELKMQVETLRSNLQAMKEDLEEKDCELAALIPSLNQNPDLNNLAWEDEASDPDNQGLTSKGNSLFSEVDDRRLLVEDQLKKYKSKCEELKTICEVKNRQMAKLRAQNVTLSNMTTGGSESASQNHRLEELLNMERSRTQSLLLRITELENNPITAGPVTVNSMATNRRESIFVSQPVAKPASANGDTGDLMNQLRVQTRQNLMLDEKLQGVLREMSTMEKNLKLLRTENYKLKMKLQTVAYKKEGSMSSELPPAPRKTAEKVFENIVFESEEPKKVEQEKKAVLFEQNLDSVFDEFRVKPKGDEEKGEKVERKSRKSTIARKVVTFSDDIEEKGEEGGDNVAATENDSPTQKCPKKVRSHQIIDAEEEIRKMNEQCPQQ